MDKTLTVEFEKFCEELVEKLDERFRDCSLEDYLEGLKVVRDAVQNRIECVQDEIDE